MTQADIIAARGRKLTNLIMENVSGINQYGIEITTVEIKLLDLPEDNKNAVFERNDIRAREYCCYIYRRRKS